MSKSLACTLNERGTKYGDFGDLAVLDQGLKRMVFDEDGRSKNQMTSQQRLAMEMILHKVARIAMGDPDHVDSWHDIGGYAKLAEDSILSCVHVPQAPPPPAPSRNSPFRSDPSSS